MSDKAEDGAGPSSPPVASWLLEHVDEPSPPAEEVAVSSPPPPPAGVVGLDQPPTFEPAPFPPVAAPAEPVPLEPPTPTTPGVRVGSAVVELVLFVAGLGVFWVVWWVALWRQGGSPARQVLKLDAVRADGAGPASWRRSAKRELPAKLLLPLAPVSALVTLAGGRGLWDRFSGTTIVAAR